VHSVKKSLKNENSPRFFGFEFGRRTIPLHLANFPWAASRIECPLDSEMARRLLILIEMSFIYLLQIVCVYANCHTVTLRGRAVLKMTNENFDNRFIFEKLQTTSRNSKKRPATTTRPFSAGGQAELASPDPADARKHIDELKSKNSQP